VCNLFYLLPGVIRADNKDYCTKSVRKLKLTDFLLQIVELITSPNALFLISA